MNNEITCQQENFEMLLKKRQISERELSRRTGIDKSTLGRWKKQRVKEARVTPEQAVALINELVLPEFTTKEASIIRKALVKFLEIFPATSEAGEI